MYENWAWVQFRDLGNKGILFLFFAANLVSYSRQIYGPIPVSVKIRANFRH